MKKAIVLTISLLLASCTTSISDEGMKVQVVNTSKEVEGMTFIGHVEGYSGWGGAMKSKGYRSAFNECINEAADLGATHVLIQPNGRTSWVSGQTVHGQAYKKP